MNNPMAFVIQMLPQIKADPMRFIMQRRFNVPQNIINDPDAIVNHLLRTGQVSQNAVNMAYQQASQYRR